ncbi:hypothetical protein Tco_0990271 [Tanacetum coccineum]|uniref:Uncharacterized protein n=1 Tax=Tanacetum coccineum TaxID=301880 RepID=A0ABQ5EWD9_9ASTR
MLRAFSLFLLALTTIEVFGAEGCPEEEAGSVVAWSPLVIISIVYVQLIATIYCDLHAHIGHNHLLDVGIRSAGRFGTLYKLVKAKYKSTRPVEDLDLVLWNDLKTMFEPHVEDNILRNQQDYKVLSWKLYDSCGVHFLRMQAQEQEELSVKENATLFQQLLEKTRKHFAVKRAEEKRNKPPTKTQQRKIIAFKRLNTFEDFRTELVEGKEKRAGIELAQEVTKKQKVEDDKEKTKIKIVNRNLTDKRDK